jgi:hypothetical protein
MTYGIARDDLHRLLCRHVDVRPELRDEASRTMDAMNPSGAFVVGVHYRGTDSTHSLFGLVNDYRTGRVPYEVYADEVRHVIDRAAPSDVRVLVATDEVDFLEFMRREFGDARIVCLADAPRVRAGGAAVHFDRTLPVSNYDKGKAGVIDCLLLSATNYLIKGRSNLSDASLIFNPRLPYSLCLR